MSPAYPEVRAAGGLWRRAKDIAAAPPSLEPVALAQEATRATQEIHIVARKYTFSPRRIEVQENDLVKVTLETTEILHSFVIDDDNYRIAKRATPGPPGGVRVPRGQGRHLPLLLQPHHR